MKILVLWPPQIPSYFNAGHHLPIFQVGEYLRHQTHEQHQVQCLDAGVLNYSWKDLGDIFFQGQYDLIAVMNDFDSVDGLERTIRYARRLLPSCRIMTFGRLSKQVPEYFKRLDLDAIVESGDYEAGVAAYADSGNKAFIPGVSVKINGQWFTGPAGVYLPAEVWALPDVTEIPYLAYEFLYKKDQNKFCGIPDRRELVVPLARGCPVGCSYCDVPTMQGRAERRMSVERVITYIEESFRKEKFQYVSFYAPTFTLKEAWVMELCQKLIDRGARYPWKCVTTLFHLNENLIKAMAESGCVRISIGLETLDPGASGALPKVKQDVEKKFDQIAQWCALYGIELNCFVILGLPGETTQGMQRTIEKVRSVNARVRPTVYTPYNKISALADAESIGDFNRQFVIDRMELTDDDERSIYDVIFGPEHRLTRVMEKIPEFGKL